MSAGAWIRRLLVGSILVCGLLSGGCGAPGEVACPGCSVVLISIDTLRADHLGLYGYPRDTSPFLDEFAADALVFDQAISQSAWTTPAHASMFTGLLPSEHGLLVYPSPGRLADSVPTLAGWLASNGYRTASFHGGGFVGAEFGLGSGFETYRSRARNFSLNLNAARNWLRHHDGERFFLFLHGFDVHRPYDEYDDNDFVPPPSPDYDITSFCNYESRPREGAELAYIVAQYDAGIRHVDGLLREFLRQLDAAGRLDEAVVIITSDHGEEFFEHGACDHTHSVYRELVHVPLIIRLPSRARGRFEAPVAASVAILPTVASLLGIAAPIPSRFDLLPVIRGGPEQAPVWSETAFYRGNSRAGFSKVVDYARGITTDRYRLLFHSSGGEERWELYDAQRDPGDHSPLTGVDTERERDLRSRLFPPDGRPRLPDLPAIDEQRLGTETRERLRALGYGL